MEKDWFTRIEPETDPVKWLREHGASEAKVAAFLGDREEKRDEEAVDWGAPGALDR